MRADRLKDIRIPNRQLPVRFATLLSTLQSYPGSMDEDIDTLKRYSRAASQGTHHTVDMTDLQEVLEVLYRVETVADRSGMFRTHDALNGFGAANSELHNKSMRSLYRRFNN